jgi:hypothetical protein
MLAIRLFYKAALSAVENLWLYNTEKEELSRGSRGTEENCFTGPQPGYERDTAWMRGYALWLY